MEQSAIKILVIGRQDILDHAKTVFDLFHQSGTAHCEVFSMTDPDSIYGLLISDGHGIQGIIVDEDRTFGYSIVEGTNFFGHVAILTKDDIYEILEANATVHNRSYPGIVNGVRMILKDLGFGEIDKGLKDSLDNSPIDDWGAVPERVIRVLDSVS